MATGTKTRTRKATAKFIPNDKPKRIATQKKNQCQMCQKKVQLKDQYTVTNDLEAGTVTKRKIGARAKNLAEGTSHYCEDCAPKRVKRGEYFIKRREDGTWGQTLNGKGKAKKAAARKAAKAKAKPAKKAARPKPQKKAKAAVKPKAKAKAAAKPRAKAAKASPKPAAKHRRPKPAATATDVDPF
jgi:hypothetical protein